MLPRGHRGYRDASWTPESGSSIVALMPLHCPTPPERLVDAKGRPYFLWDTDITLVRFKELLRDGEEVVRTHLICKLMRQAKPDDVFTFVSLKEICDVWPAIEYRLGRTRDFWTWMLTQWGVLEPE